MKQLERINLESQEVDHPVRSPAGAIWYATAQSWMEQIGIRVRRMAEQIRADPDCILATIFTANKLEKFEWALGDTSTMLNDVYLFIGRSLVNPVAVTDEE